MILVSGNIRGFLLVINSNYGPIFCFWQYMGISAGVLLGGASNESGVVDDVNFWRFECLLLRNLQR